MVGLGEAEVPADAGTGIMLHSPPIDPMGISIIAGAKVLVVT
jgi:hypothetical protein